MFTEHVFTTMQERDLLRLRGPLGIFFLREDSTRPILLVAGGTGFAPIKAIIEHALAANIQRPLHLYWGVRARRDLYRHALAESWAQAYPQFRYTPVLSEPMPDDHWTGRTGFVHEVVAADHTDLSGHAVYGSGPPPMIEAIKQSFFARGLPPEQLHYDSFEFAHAL
jgi:CDP-4-dehydro-6-deoxyglucose reductase, E3